MATAGNRSGNRLGRLEQGPDGSSTGAGKQQGPAQPIVDDSNASTCYANFCRVTGTPEELIVDFGLTAEAFSDPTQPVVIAQRVITNLYTAKRLLHVLQLTLDRHEAAFGALETDVQRRVRRTN